MRIAFKEWAIVEDALASGRQILIFRKGGISEGRGGFKPEHDRFLLFPTLFHQQRDSVIPEAQARHDQIAHAFPPPEILRIQHFCEVADWRCVESLEVSRRLDAYHIWRPEVIQDRFDWGKQKAIFALIVRVHRLPQPTDLPMLPTYGGCKSWIELDRDIDTTGSVPVLNDAEFAARLRQIQTALG
jgi:hypothetical protein